jgi:Tol biopolymer transport system component/actin-like ATPase involved in cell morphogenesis
VGYQLGVDLGTTYTAAAVIRRGQAEVATLGTRSLEIPSVVYLRDDGEMLIGEAAERRSLTEPDRFAREFKRRIGDPTPVMLGGSPFSAHTLMAKLLRAVVKVVADREGAPPDHVTVTHPANWGEYKRELLYQSLHQADVGTTSTVTEPEAAAVHYASQTRVASGQTLAVYDLGGGTFDAAIVRKDGERFTMLGEPQGIEQLGGVYFDDAVFNYVSGYVSAALDQLDPDDPGSVAAVSRLRRDCVEAKEALSWDTDTTIPVALPNQRTEVRLTRSEFEDMARPALAESIEAMRRALRSAGVDASELSAVLLVGGSSRIPLVGQMLMNELQRPVAIDVHPKHAVALGAAHVALANAAPTAPPAAAGRAGTTAVAGAAAAGAAAPSVTQPDPPPDPPGPVRSGDFPAQPGGVPSGGYPAQPGEVPSGGYPAQPGDPGSGGYPAQPGGVPSGGYPAQQPGGPGSGGFPAQDGDPGSGGYAATNAAGAPVSTDLPPLGRSGERERVGSGSGGEGSNRVRVAVGAGVAVVLAIAAFALFGGGGGDDPEGTTTTSAGEGSTTSGGETPTDFAVEVPKGPAMDTQTLAYTRREGNFWNIWLIRQDTGESTQLTREQAVEPRLPVWSPDRTSIAYTVQSGGAWELWVTDTQGNAKVQLATALAADARATWSPDGTELAFVSEAEGQADLYALSLVTGEQRRVTNTAETEGDPAWSPDGSEIAYWSTVGGNQDIYAVPAAGGEARRITEDPAGDADPAWNPTGDGSLAFSRDPLGDGNWDIFVKAADGTETRLTETPNGDEDPAWSPDGAFIAFESRRDVADVEATPDFIEVYVMAGDGSNPTRLTTRDGLDAHPAWGLSGPAG